MLFLSFSMASAYEMPVFIDSSLGTHIAMPLSPDITAADFKRKLAREHYLCFPYIGEIRIRALMVKRKLCFYHLADSMPVINAFKGLKGTWFLHMDATCVEHMQCQPTATGKHCLSGFKVVVPKSNITQDESLSINPNDKILSYGHSFKSKTCGSEGKIFFSPSQKDEGASTQEQFGHFGSKKETIRKEETSSHSMNGAPSASSSEIISVAGIITKYFSKFNEVHAFDSNAGNVVHTLQWPEQSKDQEMQKLGEIRDTNSTNSTSTIAELCVNRNRTKGSNDKKGGNAMSCVNVTDEYVVCQGHHDDSCKATVNNYCSRILTDDDDTRQSGTKSPPMMPSFSLLASPSMEIPRSKLGRSEVGKRLLVAANGLGISLSNQKPVISLCQSAVDSRSLVRNIIFEISDGDD
ncbi:uncharacterized protein LOC143849932 [Tasmannia lanceolata]|uniref:uncharacterized protein LOC143849932 n=1 Tax=Tasmannia lanceolata TaxID=3420 RepID=UPI004063C6AD